MVNSVLFDIGHPAHVHYFKNIISQMELNGIKVNVLARDKDVTISLLEAYKIRYENRGKGGLSLLGKILYWFKYIFITYNYIKKTKPDVMVSFAGTYAAHASKLCGIPHVCFTDTESARIGILALLPFTEILITPNCFKKSYGIKHVRFNGIFDLSYLSPGYFSPDRNIYKILNIPIDKPYAIIRFVSWSATHDVGEKGMPISLKRDLIFKLSKYVKVFISSEHELSKELEPYKIKIPVEKMHDTLAFASLYFGEGATMATESAILGTPAICMSSLAHTLGYFELLNKYKLIHHYEPKYQNEALEKALSIVKNKTSKSVWLNRRNIFLKDMINVNEYMLDKIENLGL